MSLPNRNASWPELVTYFKNNKNDGENLGIILKRASAYRKTGKIVEGVKMRAKNPKITAKNRNKKSIRGGKKNITYGKYSRRQ